MWIHLSTVIGHFATSCILVPSPEYWAIRSGCGIDEVSFWGPTILVFFSTFFPLSHSLSLTLTLALSSFSVSLSCGSSLHFLPTFSPHRAAFSPHSLLFCPTVLFPASSFNLGAIHCSITFFVHSFNPSSVFEHFFVA